MKNGILKIILTGIVAGTMLSTPAFAQDMRDNHAGAHGEKHADHKMNHRGHKGHRGHHKHKGHDHKHDDHMRHE